MSTNTKKLILHTLQKFFSRYKVLLEIW